MDVKSNIKSERDRQRERVHAGLTERQNKARGRVGEIWPGRGGGGVADGRSPSPRAPPCATPSPSSQPLLLVNN